MTAKSYAQILKLLILNRKPCTLNPTPYSQSNPRRTFKGPKPRI